MMFNDRSRRARFWTGGALVATCAGIVIACGGGGGGGGEQTQSTTPDPEVARQDFADALDSGDVAKAVSLIVDDQDREEEYRTLFAQMTLEELDAAAGEIRNATLIEETEGYREYVVVRTLPDGTRIAMPIQMVLMEGQWKILSY